MGIDSFVTVAAVGVNAAMGIAGLSGRGGSEGDERGSRQRKNRGKQVFHDIGLVVGGFGAVQFLAFSLD